MVKRLFSIFAVLTLFFVAVGCGDDDPQPAATDDTEAEGTTPETTEAEEAIALDDWVDGADEICGDTDEAMSELVEPTDEEDVDQAIEYLQDLVEVQQGQLDALTELGAPDDEAESVEEALGLLNDQVELVETAIDDLEDGDDLEEVFTTVMEEGEELSDDLTELAEALGLDVCGTATSGSDDPPTTGSSGEPFTYGDDPELDALWDECEAGDAEACDSLYFESPIDSEYEEFGLSCGGVVPEGETFDCTAVLDSSNSNSGDDEIGVDPFTYGDDPALDEMWDDCEDGRPEACDDLFRESPVDSEYEEFGRTCGGRLEGIEAQTTYCVDAM